MLLKMVYLAILGSLAVGINNGVSASPLPEQDNNPGTLEPAVVYAEDFDNLTVGTTDIIGSTELIWVETNYVDATISSASNGNYLSYMVTGDDGSGYSKFGGIGIGDNENLANLITGRFYHFSLDINFLSASTNSLIYIEYQNNTYGWTGVKAYQNGALELLNNGNNIYDASYSDGVLSFIFQAGTYSATENSYFSLTGFGFDVTDTVGIDNLYIQREYRSFGEDFENISVGSTTLNNFYNASFDSQIVATDVENNYLQYNKTASADTWSNFYINNLSNYLVSGTRYQLAFDLDYVGLSEFYIIYHGNWGVTNTPVTYGIDHSVILPTSAEYIKMASYTDNHVTVDFVPNESVGGDWAQMLLVFKHSTDLTLNIDNVALTEIDPFTLTLDTSAVKTSYYLNEDVDLSGLVVTAQRESGDFYQLTPFEYTIDDSAIDKFTAGTYFVTVSSFDQEGIALVESFQVVYSEDAVDQLVVTAPAKTSYQYGEDLNLNGLTATIIYESGKSEVISSGYTVSENYDAHQLGQQTITVTYGTFQDTFIVTVSDYMMSISIKTAPTKTAYVVGDSLDVSGMTITVTYASGATETIDVTNSMVSNFDSTMAGIVTLTLNYEGLETTYDITIEAAPKPDNNNVLIYSLIGVGGVLIIGGLVWLFVFRKKKAS